QIKTEDLSMILKKFVTTLITALTGDQPNNNNNNSPRVNQGFRQDQLENLVCIFCGLLGHFISDCLVCQMYINDGKCKKNAEGEVVLPNGQFMPRNIPGHCIKDCINEWICRNPDINIVPALMYSIAPSPTPAPTPRGIYQITDMNTAADISPSTTSQTTSNSQSMPNSQPLVSLQPPIHPYATAMENTYLPPHERNFASTSKDGPLYHTVAPIQNNTITQDIFLHSMKIPIVTLTTEELLLLSPKVHMKWKEQLTPHHILNQDGNNTGHLVNEEVLMINDPYKTYISSLRIGDIPKPFITAKESHSIRSVMMNVNGKNPVESVVDPGSSIIAMSKEVCHELGLAYDPSIHIPLQSANGGIDKSLGLA
ncbi:hypothetical protein L208DRAFT_1332202, partial [Tricholoma matsutake]